MAEVKAMVKKALRVRKKLFLLARAKEDTLRELAGLPPAMTWCEKFKSAMSMVCRTILCRIFCPRICWAYGYTWKEILCPRTMCWGRMFYRGTYENEILKNFLGFLFGLGLTFLLYSWMSLQLGYPLKKAALITCFIGFYLTLGLAFSDDTRCLVLLTLPHMFSKKGRSILLVYATVLVFRYPVSNFSNNLTVLSDSATCAQGLVLNETQKLFKMAKEPLASIIDALKEMLEKIKRFAAMLQAAFQSLIRAVKEITGAIAKVFKWLGSLVNICNDRMGEPYTKCVKAFDDAYSDCSRRMGIFDFLCEIVSLASHICHIARIGEFLCMLASLIKRLVVDTIRALATATIRDLYDMFYFNVTVKNNFTYSINQSRSYTEAKEAIMKDISDRIAFFSKVLNLVDSVMLVTTFLAFIRAYRYRQSYLKKDRFDNYYITDQVYAVDSKRRQMGRECLFPLKPAEQRKYITACSPLVTKKEAKKMLKGLVLWALAAYHACFFLFTDYALFWILATLTRLLSFKVSTTIPDFLKLHVEGVGSMADMYRAMVDVLNPVASTNLEIDSTSCLPRPSHPDFAAYRTIVLLYVLCLTLAILEAYGLRLRRAVAAYYYPSRERQRAIWLYNTMMYKRGSFFIFARRQLRRKIKNDTEIQKYSFRGRLVRSCPCLGRLLASLGFEHKACMLCGKEGRPNDTVNFVHCGNYGCKGVYCQECYEDLNNLCTVCMNPVDYGDIEDASEEIDSSEDEEVIKVKKARARERRAIREAKEKEKDPSQAMGRIKQMFITPSSYNASLQQAFDKIENESQPLLERDDALNTSIAIKMSSDDDFSASTDTENYDMAYQEASKSGMDTSSAEEETHMDTSSQPAGSTVRKKPQYETEDIFQSSTED